MLRKLSFVVMVSGLFLLGGCGPRVGGMDQQQLAQAMAPSNKEGLRKAAALELGRRGGPESEQVLEQNLNDPDPDVQIKVMHALAVYMYDRKAAPLIAPLMSSPNSDVARKAISCIKHLDYSQAVPQLRHLRDTSTHPGVVRAAQGALIYFRRHG